MKPPSDDVVKFFEAYEEAIRTSDADRLASLYGEVFLFAGPQGVQSVKRDDFIKALPRRTEFFKAVGLRSSKVQSIEETRLDDRYVLVKASWEMRFERDDRAIVNENSATYILRGEDATWRIVFQLDHQDLMKRVQELGLSPATDRP